MSYLWEKVVWLPYQPLVATALFTYNITSFNHPISLDIPTKYICNLENLTTVVNTLDSLHICPDNLEMEFIQLSIKSNGQFKDMQGKGKNFK